MYPLHKYLPTPFGTYLLYIDNGPTRFKASKEKPQLPSYQALKEHGRRQNQANHTVSKYQAFPRRHESDQTVPAKPITAPLLKQENRSQRKFDALTPSSTMPHSIWSPKVKRMHLSYNMRQLWHTGQPVKATPQKPVEVDDITGAELSSNAPWFKGRSSKEHEQINVVNSFESPTNKLKRQSGLSVRSESVALRKDKTEAQYERSGRSRRREHHSSVSSTSVLSENYKRQASQLGNDMIPRRHKRYSKLQSDQKKIDQYYASRINKETQTTPARYPSTSIDYSDSSRTTTPSVFGHERSTSVPLITPASTTRSNKTKQCMEMTGLPPILENDSAIVPKDVKPIPRAAVTVEPDMRSHRVRRVQEFRSASPTFPIKSKKDYWEEMNKCRMRSLPSSHNLLPFTWKEPRRYTGDKSQWETERKSDVENILPVITRLPSESKT